MQHRKPTCISCLQDHLTALGYRQTNPCSLSGLHVFNIALLLASLSSYTMATVCGGGTSALVVQIWASWWLPTLPDCCIAGRWKFPGLWELRMGHGVQ